MLPDIPDSLLHISVSTVSFNCSEGATRLSIDNTGLGPDNFATGIREAEWYLASKHDAESSGLVTFRGISLNSVSASKMGQTFAEMNEAVLDFDRWQRVNPPLEILDFLLALQRAFVNTANDAILTESKLA